MFMHVIFFSRKYNEVYKKSEVEFVRKKRRKVWRGCMLKFQHTTHLYDAI